MNKRRPYNVGPDTGWIALLLLLLAAMAASAKLGVVQYS